MTRSIVVACAAMAALVSHASGTKELNDGDKLADAVADEAAYDEIILHKGTYSITETVVVDRKMTIRGADGTTPDEVILQGNLTCGLIQLSAAGSLLSGITLTGGKVEGTGTSTGYRYGAAVNVNSASVVSNCVIKGNVLPNKYSVGVIAFRAANAVLTHSRVTGNTFKRECSYGGAIGLAVHASAAGYIRNSLFDDNEQTSATGSTGALIGNESSSKLYIINCTVVNNRVKADIGAFGNYRGASYVVVANTIAMGNTKNGTPVMGSATYYNCLTDVAVTTGSDNNTSDTGIFFDYNYGDYHLFKGSVLAIDTGTENAGGTTIRVEDTDLDGKDRVIGDKVDIGCYEYDPNAVLASFTQSADAGVEPLSVTFVAVCENVGEHPQYEWDFNGDGQADLITDQATVTNTFTKGIYPVTLCAKNLDTGRRGIYVTKSPIAVEPASVSFSQSPSAGTEPLEVTFVADCPWTGKQPQYSWDFNADGVVDAVTTEPTVQHVYQRGEYAVALYATNLEFGVGAVHTNASFTVAQGITYKADTDWFFEPFGEPLKVTLTGDLGETPKFYWDLNDDGVAEAITDTPVWRPTLVAGEYHVTVCASNVEAGVGVTIAAEDGMTILPRPLVTVEAADPEVGVTAADIQATIDAAERGSIVTIPAGTYDVKGTPIKVVKEIELRGETGNPKDVVLKNTATHHRIMNVDGGPHCLIHSLTLANGKGSKKANDAFEFVSGLMIASESGFEGVSNSRGTGATKGGCVSNVVVRGCSCGGNYGDPSTVYIKGPKARFTHSVISNNSATVTWAGNMFNTLALFVCGGAKADNLLVCNNTCTVSGSSYPSWLTVPVTVNGAGSVLRFSTIVNNVGGLCGGVNVYDGGRFEHCVIAGGRAFDGGNDSRRNVWTAYNFGESGRISANNETGRATAREAEATRAATESIYSIQTNNAVDVADCLNETTVYATTAELKPIYRKGAWRLPAGSPAIDVVPAKDVSGMPEKDLNGNRRLVNTLYDLGAFELPNPCGLMLLVK